MQINILLISFREEIVIGVNIFVRRTCTSRAIDLTKEETNQQEKPKSTNEDNSRLNHFHLQRTIIAVSTEYILIQIVLIYSVYGSVNKRPLSIHILMRILL